MDVWQLSHGRLPWLLWRRLSWLLFTTAVGAWLGTRILISVPERFIYLALAVMILVFLASTHLSGRQAEPARRHLALGPVHRRNPALVGRSDE
jgi:uncharacterized membrane protein YfcA